MLKNLVSSNQIQTIYKVLISVCILTFTYKFFNGFHKSRRIKKLLNLKRQQLKAKKDLLHQKIVDSNITSEQVDIITHMKVYELLTALQTGTIKSDVVLRAYQHRALEMDKELNFIIDINTDTESFSAESSSTVGNLLKDIPVSIKDSFCVKNCDCTFGMPRFVCSPLDDDAVIIKVIRLHGAIPFVITNMCQSGKSFESSNPIIGETKNPYNSTRTCGGSSGGEGAILGCGASILGLGGDIGGSIRIPAHFCGVFGLKPTSIRLSTRGNRIIGASQKLIVATLGPMARSIYDLVHFYKILISADVNRLDPNCPLIPFNETAYNSKRPLRIGFYIHLGGSQVVPVPAVKRAILLAKRALELSGHTLIEVQIPNIDYAVFDLYFRCLFTDGGLNFLKDFIGDDPIDHSLRLTVFLLRLPNFLKIILSFILLPFNKGYSRAVKNLTGCSSIYSLWLLKGELDKYGEEFLKFMISNKLDGLVGPVLPMAAPPLGATSKILDVIGYTSLYNVLDYPAGSVPVTKVTVADIEELESSYPTDTPTHRFLKLNQKGSRNLPIGVQCISYKWREEICLRMMRDIIEHL